MDNAQVNREEHWRRNLDWPPLTVMVGAKLPDELAEALRARAGDDEVTAAELIRRALELYLGTQARRSRNGDDAVAATASASSTPPRAAESVRSG